MLILAIPVDKGGSVSPNVRLHVGNVRYDSYKLILAIHTHHTHYNTEGEGVFRLQSSAFNLTLTYSNASFKQHSHDK